MDIQERIKALKSLPCADPNCDGKGTVCLGAHEHESGEVEWDIHQCQMCDYRDKATGTMEKLYADNKRLTEKTEIDKITMDNFLGQLDQKDAELERLSTEREKLYAVYLAGIRYAGEDLHDDRSHLPTSEYGDFISAVAAVKKQLSEA